MPNWCFNYLTVSGESDKVDAVKKQVSQSFDLKYWQFESDDYQETRIENPVFALWNIKHPDDAILDEYFAKQPIVKSELALNDPNWWADIEAKRKISNHWYDWNITHWGTKWDVHGNAEIVEEIDRNAEEKFILYKFDTAWAPPAYAIEALALQYPELYIELEYEEEQGWGGSIAWKNNEIIDQTEYDIPSCHQDYVDRDRDCICLHNGPEWAFEDCGFEKEGYEWNKEDSQWQKK